MNCRCPNCGWVNSDRPAKCKNCRAKRTERKNVSVIIGVDTMFGGTPRGDVGAYKYRQVKAVENVQTFADGTAWG